MEDRIRAIKRVAWTEDASGFVRLLTYVLGVALLVPMYVVGRGHAVLVAAMVGGLSGGLAVPLLLPLLHDSNRPLHRRLTPVLLGGTTMALSLFALTWGAKPLLAAGTSGGAEVHPLVSAGLLSLFVIGLLATGPSWSRVERGWLEIGLGAGLVLSLWLVHPLWGGLVVLAPVQLAVFVLAVEYRTTRRATARGLVASVIVAGLAFLLGSLAQGQVLPPRVGLGGWAAVVVQPAIVLLVLGTIPTYAFLVTRSHRATPS